MYIKGKSFSKICKLFDFNCKLNLYSKNYFLYLGKEDSCLFWGVTQGVHIELSGLKVSMLKQSNSMLPMPSRSEGHRDKS